MLRRFILFLLVAASAASFGFTGFPVHEDIVRNTVAPIENFLTETIRRTGCYWTMAFAEFEEMREALQDEPRKFKQDLQEDLSEALRKGVDKVLDSAAGKILPGKGSPSGNEPPPEK